MKIYIKIKLQAATAAAATVAKLLQSCPTLCDRIDSSPTGVGCHFLLQCMKVKSENEVSQSYLILRDPMDCSIYQATYQAPLSMGFSRQEYWSGVPLPSPCHFIYFSLN